MRAAVWMSIALSAVAGGAAGQSAIPPTVPHDFRVFEFRRYTVAAGTRERFATYFDAYFPEAFEQVGAIAVGQFLERKNPNGFTWLRGFHSLEERAAADAAFYYGPLWHEHAKTANDLLLDSDNVLLLEPLGSERQPTILPTVDPVIEPNGAHGIVVAQIFTVAAGQVGAFARAAESTFARYRSIAGVREAAVLVTLDVKNNFPQLPIRTDGPYLVWLGVVKDETTLDNELQPVADRNAAVLSATGFLRSAPEWDVMIPTHRSRLRWWSEP